ncbi:MAG: hypothetical protein ABIS27_08360 [Longimicrobiales bacterium]
MDAVRESEPVVRSLEWPPPGLEQLHSQLRTVRSRAMLATLFIAPPIVWLLVGMSVSERALRGAVGVLIAIGLFFFLRAILNAARILDASRRGRNLGYAPRLLLEVAVDDSRDTASLIAGTGAYESVRERTRDRIRGLRILAQLLRLAAAVLPLPLVCVALPLALRGAADGLAVALIPALPFFFFSLTAAITIAYAAVLAQWDRGSDAWDPSPVTLGERAAAWQAVTRTHRPVRPTGGFLIVLLGAAGGIVLFVSVAFALVTVAGYGIAVQEVSRIRSYAPQPRSLLGVEIMRDWRLPADSAITPRQAGDALHALLYAGRVVAPGMLEPARGFNARLWPSRGADTYLAASLWRAAIGRDSLQWFAKHPDYASLDSLHRIAPHPALRMLDILARATDIDVTASRYRLPLERGALDEAGGFSHANDAKDVEAAVFLAAARRYNAGDRAGAELLLRELISAGFLLIDRSPFVRDFWMGYMWVSRGKWALAELYRVTGRAAEADGLARSSAAADRVAVGTGGGFDVRFGADGFRDPPDPTLEGALRTIRSPHVYPSIRWTAFQSAVPVARCGTLRRAMFGPGEFTDLLLAQARTNVIRIPSDSALAAVVLDPAGHSAKPPFELSRRPGFRRLQRTVLFVIGDHQLAGPCAGAFTSRF